MALFKILKGNSDRLNGQNIVNGYCYVTLDEQKMYIDHQDETTGKKTRFCLNASHADEANLSTFTLGGNYNIDFTNKTPKQCYDLSSSQTSYYDILYGHMYFTSGELASMPDDMIITPCETHIIKANGYNSLQIYQTIKYYLPNITGATGWNLQDGYIEYWRTNASDINWNGWEIGTAPMQQAGDATTPIYINGNGEPTACRYQLNETVPKDAKFTDTTYNIATTSVAGLVKSGTDINVSSTGRVTVPHISTNSVGASGGTFDLNTYYEAGKFKFWNLSSNGTYENAPDGTSKTRIGLYCYPISSSAFAQEAFVNGKKYFRVSTNSSTADPVVWADWQIMPSMPNGTSIGGTITPIYYSASSKTFKPCTYTLGASVPSNAKFTDTTYDLVNSNTNGLMAAADKIKLDGISENADAVSFTQSLTSGTVVGTLNINGTDTILYAPTNTDTHYKATLHAAASGATTNANTDTANPYLILRENGTTRSELQLQGSGATSISAKNGIITINSTDTEYGVATDTVDGLMSAADKAKLNGIAANATANKGDITGVTAGKGLTGGATSGTATLNVGAGAGISVTADAVALATIDGLVTTKTYGPSSNVSGSNGATMNVPSITIDEYGRVTSITNKTYTAVDTDQNVKQTLTSSNATYPLLLAPSGTTATKTAGAYFDSGVTLNPSTNTIAANISGNAATADKWKTARTISLTGDVTGSGTFDGSNNLSITATVADDSHNHNNYLPLAGGTMTGAIITPGNDSVVIRPAKNNYDQIGSSNYKFWQIYATTFYGTLSGNASTATKLQTSRTIRTNLSSTTAPSFDGTANITPGVSGILNIANGGTGGTTKNAAYTNLLHQGQLSDADLDLKRGLYSYFTSSTNVPGSYGCVYNVIANEIDEGVAIGGTTSGSWVWQVAFDTSQTAPYIRNSVNAGAFNTWRRFWIQGDAVTGAVWNDYAECRESDCEDFGYVLMEVGDDSLTKTTERLSHFAGVSSDTWGFSQGETDKAKTPIAVAGRVLVYPYQDRNNYKPGDCVCAAPNGTVDIMTREEVINYPDRIVGTVSCVPDYEEWGGGKIADRPSVKVNNRIWIKVK